MLAVERSSASRPTLRCSCSSSSSSSSCSYNSSTNSSCIVKSRAGLAWSRLVICSRSSRLSCTAAAAMPTPPQRSTLGLTTCRRATRLCKQLNSCSHTALQVGRNSRAAAAAAIAAGSIAVAAAAQGGTTAALTAVQPPAVAEQHQGLTFLQELRVSDFALVPFAAVRLAPGLNAISGQSGAGKSVLIDALAQLLGAPAQADCVRPPADTAVVEGTWWCGPGVAAAAAELLAEMGLPSKALPGVWGAAAGATAGGGVIHIRREISCMPMAGSPAAGGSTAAAAAAAAARSRVLINGSPSSLRVLRALAPLLVDVNGQHASLALRDSNQQLQLLDRIAGTTGLAAQLSAGVSRLALLESRLSQAESLADGAERAALQKKVDLIQRANITPGEEVQLRRRLAALESRRGCLEAAAAVQAGIQGDSSSGGGSPGLAEALRLVQAQLRGVITSEEQQLRLMTQERQQRRAQQKAAGVNGNGHSRGKVGRADAGGEVEAAEEEAAGDDDDDAAGAAEEAALRSSAVKALHAALESLEVVGDELLEAQAQLQAYAGVAGYSPAEAAALSSRLELVEKLTRRFRVRGSSELLGLAEAWSDQLEQYYDTLGQQEVWRAEVAALQAQVTGAALQLSAARRSAAVRLSAAVQSCLSQLAMSSSRFGVDISWTPAGQAEQQAGLSSRAVLAPVSEQPQPLLASEGTSSSSSNSNSSSSLTGDSPDTTSSSSSSSVVSALFKLSPCGLDSVTFLLSAGPAEPLRALADTASGGEAARIMLALKAAPAAAAAAAEQQQTSSHHRDLGAGATAHTVGSGNGGELHNSSSSSSTSSGSSGSGGAGCDAVVSVGPPVLVMDELDAGLGSRLGEPVGRLLARLVGGGGHPPAACQVLVVTHTPQVAAHASHHIQVVKGAAEDGRVITTFKHLATAEERQAELADMFGLGAEEAAHLAADLLAAAHGPAAAAAAAAKAPSDSSDGSRAVVGAANAPPQLQGDGLPAGGAETAGDGTQSSSSSSSSSSNCSSVSEAMAESKSSSSHQLLMGLSAAAAAAGVAAAEAEESAGAASHD